MKRILFIRDDDSELRIDIESVLKKISHYELVCVSIESLSQSTLLQENRFDVLIFDTILLDKAELSYLYKLGRLSDEKPILILANQITIYAYRQVDEMSNMVAVQKPFDPNVFLGVLEKAAYREDFRPRKCPRFITNQPARVVVLNTGLLIPIRVRNYSAGGAFLEYRGISLKVGDQIQLSFADTRAAKPAESIQVQAKVVWIRDGEQDRSSLRGVGVQFVT